MRGATHGSQERKPSSKLRVGIIGTGTHGTRYARHVTRDVDDIQLAAISRRSASGRAQAANWGCRWYGDWRDLVADRAIDAVIAAATPDLNVDIAGACVAAGRPLLIEKPLAVDFTRARRIVDLFAEARIPLTVGQTLRYNPVILNLKRHLPRVGELYFFSATHRLEPSTHSWLADPAVAGGGVILHTAVHLFDALRFITGRECIRVRATMGSVHNPHLEDRFAALIEMQGDLSGTADASKIGASRSGRYEFVGRQGQLQGDQIHGRLDFIDGADLHPLGRFEAANTLVPLLRDWRDLLLHGSANPIPGAEGAAAVRICDACRESAAADRWVTL